MHQSYIEQNTGWHHAEDGRVRRRASLIRKRGSEDETMDTAPDAKASNLHIQQPNENDVLLGRGGNNNRHSGNEKLRFLARKEATLYNVSMKKQKSAISRRLVQHMRSLDPPARFLKQSKSGAWEDVGDLLAREKVSQVLRDAVQAMQEEEEAYTASGHSTTHPVTSSSHRSRPSLAEEPASHLKFPDTTPVQCRKRRRHTDPHNVLTSVDMVYHEYTWRSTPPHPQYSEPVKREFSPPRPPTAQAPIRLRRPLPISRRQSSAASNASLLETLRMGNALDFDLFNGELLESDSEARNGPPSRPSSPP